MSNQPTIKARFEEQLAGESLVALCGDDGQSIEFHGRNYQPDVTKGYIRLRMSYGFPVVNRWGQALHPNVIAASWKSLLHQPANFEHIVVAYDKDRYSADRFIGAVVDARFPESPAGGWKIGNRSDAPSIEAVMSFAKLAKGMDRVVGQHLSGRHNYAVSMEVRYECKDCAFAVALNGKKPKHDTPDDMAAAGWEYIPWTVADEELLKCFSVTRNRIVSDWKGRPVVQLLGGLGAPVHYCGLAVCQYGAEPGAAILQMAASRSNDEAERMIGPLRDFAEMLTKHSK